MLAHTRIKLVLDATATFCEARATVASYAIFAACPG